MWEILFPCIWRIFSHHFLISRTNNADGCNYDKVTLNSQGKVTTSSSHDNLQNWQVDTDPNPTHRTTKRPFRGCDKSGEFGGKYGSNHDAVERRPLFSELGGSTHRWVHHSPRCCWPSARGGFVGRGPPATVPPRPRPPRGGRPGAAEEGGKREGEGGAPTGNAGPGEGQGAGD